ncbi:MAG: NAD(P)/FAD-dependent oxidoreductase [Bacteroidales bacterium]|nr:NAD(P)/FAD-dependent oxidoreductase [Bacteroidales bacterium]
MRIIIIGAGPGGYETAAEAAAKGIEVLLVSDGPLGGTCLNEGCIPTKTFCAMDRPDQARKREVIAQLQAGISQLLKNPLITVLQGRAQLGKGTSVIVGETLYEADAVIIATGSVSASLPIPGAELAIDSSAMLELDTVPQRLCVIGGGVIGLEFASVFRKFGSEVTVLEFCPGILPRFDVDLAKRLKASLAKRGIKIETSARVTAIEENAGVRTVRWTKGDKEFSADADCVLMAVGRRPNISSLDLGAAGIEYGPRGIVVDDNMQTNVPGIYAIGDIIGGMMLAHVASAHGHRALCHLCGEQDATDLSLVPAAVFTVPEAATVGLTEEQCEGRDVAIGKSSYRANGKSVASGEPDGYCKVIADKDGGRILGAHILGAHASDLIHEAAVLIALSATVQQASSIIHAHPTVSEVLRDALRDAAHRCA